MQHLTKNSINTGIKLLFFQMHPHTKHQHESVTLLRQTVATNQSVRVKVAIAVGGKAPRT